jgi:hypothetical protein
MGAAVSLPFLSFFALPALTSYTTSLNLLFFTLNWYILLLTHPPLSVEIIGLTLVQLLCYILPAALFLAADVGLPSLAAAVKTQGEFALPGRLGGQRVGRVAVWSTVNVLLGVALMGGIDAFLTKVVGWRSALSLSKSMPMPWSIAKQVVFLLFARGVSISPPPNPAITFPSPSHNHTNKTFDTGTPILHPPLRPAQPALPTRQIPRRVGALPALTLRPGCYVRLPALLPAAPLGPALCACDRDTCAHLACALRAVAFEPGTARYVLGILDLAEWDFAAGNGEEGR